MDKPSEFIELAADDKGAVTKEINGLFAVNERALTAAVLKMNETVLDYRISQYVLQNLEANGFSLSGLPCLKGTYSYFSGNYF